jgi:Reverse transcriptase (RNA-dependent DNA polymerase)
VDLNRNRISILALTDFSKAFDTINVYFISQKLKILFNFSDLAIHIVKSYLTVVCNGAMSTFLPVTHDVPQGSILRPLLFSNSTGSSKLYIYGLYL